MHFPRRCSRCNESLAKRRVHIMNEKKGNKHMHTHHSKSTEVMDIHGWIFALKLFHSRILNLCPFSPIDFRAFKRFIYKVWCIIPIKTFYFTHTHTSHTLTLTLTPPLTASAFFHLSRRLIIIRFSYKGYFIVLTKIS